MAARRLIGEDARKKLSAKADMRKIPDWSEMGADEAEEYVEGRIKTVADARAVMKKMARMIVALRDLNLK